MKTNRANCIAIIPARGGSKGIPGKNLRVVGDAPLIAHAIRTAQRATNIARVIVTTDSAAIARVAKNEGADVVKRPASISGDTASSESALLHVLKRLAAKNEPLPEITVFLQCTSPLTLPQDVDAVVSALRTEKADSAFTATAFHGFVWKRNAAGDAIGVNHDKKNRPRRQDRDKEYVENGAVYAMRTAGFLDARHRFFGRTVISVMPAERSLDIDELSDLEQADAALRQRASTQRHNKRGG